MSEATTLCGHLLLKVREHPLVYTYYGYTYYGYGHLLLEVGEHPRTLPRYIPLLHPLTTSPYLLLEVGEHPLVALLVQRRHLLNTHSLGCSLGT